MWKVIATGVLALSAAMTTGVGISSADRIFIQGNFPTQTACLNAGPAHGPNVASGHYGPWFLFECEQHDDGLWYLYELPFGAYAP